jgi:hypothetical protein
MPKASDERPKRATTCRDSRDPSCAKAGANTEIPTRRELREGSGGPIAAKPSTKGSAPRCTRPWLARGGPSRTRLLSGEKGPRNPASKTEVARPRQAEPRDDAARPKQAGSRAESAGPRCVKLKALGVRPERLQLKTDSKAPERAVARSGGELPKVPRSSTAGGRPNREVPTESGAKPGRSKIYRYRYPRTDQNRHFIWFWRGRAGREVPVPVYCRSVKAKAGEAPCQRREAQPCDFEGEQHRADVSGTSKGKGHT